MSSFQMGPGSNSSILMVVYLSGGSKKTTRHLLAFDIGIEGQQLSWVVERSMRDPLQRTKFMKWGMDLKQY
ncbi:hypothetical protein TNCV_1485071 [Trichonephila clavipes]|nr:hypothetical protein TNCV_1485071 [Trichonephila clavipes]